MDHLAAAGLADLPAGWTVVHMAQLLSKDRGISVGVMYPGDHCPTGIPLIRAGDINGNFLNPDPELRITPAKHHEYRRTALNGGELLMTLVGRVGQCAIVPRNMAGWNAARAVAVIRLANPSDAHFVRQCLLSRPVQHLMKVWCNTTVQATLNLKDILELPVPWPPARTRDSIARIGKALDDRIELNRRMNQTLEAIAQALYREWFIEPLRHGLPTGWRTVPFAETVKILSGGTPSTSVPEYWNGNVPWFSVVDAPQMSDVFVIDTEKKITREGVENCATEILPVGSTIISARGTVGKLALVAVPMAMNQSCYGLAPLAGGKGYHSYYAARALVTELKQRAHGSVFDTITRGTLASVAIAQPPPALTQKFEDAIAPCMERIKNNLFESRTLAQLRDALLPKLLSGALRVTDPETFLAAGT